MNNTFIKLALVILVTSSFSCGKDRKKWKLPTDVKFKMDMNRTVTLGGNLSWTSGNIIVSYFTFNGQREQSSDVNFTKDYPSGLNVFFDPTNPVPAWDFDIPQGTYHQINVSFRTYGSTGDDHIVIKGTYKNTSTSVVYPVQFEFEAEEYYNVTARNSSGGTKINLEKDKPVSATIKVDPVYWFQTVTTGMMDNATLVVVNGNPTILINDDTNEDIFDLVRDRIDDNVTTVIFN
jgi:hypothetical protein